MIKELQIKPEKPITRDQILGFEEALKEHPEVFIGDTDLCPLIHKFTPGIYVREIFIPAGTLLTGKIHKHEHPNFLMSGEVDVITEDGGRERLKGPVSIISPAGTKRVVHALTDTVWITVHHNPGNHTDLDKLEDAIIAPSYEAFEKFVKLENNYFSPIRIFTKSLIKKFIK